MPSVGELEQDLAAFYGVPYGMVFSTGYAANLGTLVALLNPGDAALLDADAHAASPGLSKATNVPRLAAYPVEKTIP